jgi:hypothetical protein
MDPMALPLATMLATRPASEVRARVANYLQGKHVPATMDTELPMTAVGG